MFTEKPEELLNVWHFTVENANVQEIAYENNKGNYIVIWY